MLSLNRLQNYKKIYIYTTLRVFFYVLSEFSHQFSLNIAEMCCFFFLMFVFSKLFCIFASRFSIKSGEMPTNRPLKYRWQRW